MSIRNGIYDLLAAVDSAVYPIGAPQETTGSYAVYFIRRERALTQDRTGPYSVFLTIHFFAKEIDDAETMAATFEAGLDNGSGTYDGETLMVCNWMSSEDGTYLPDIDKYSIIQEYQLYFA
jgi:hypothetical protein